MIDAERYEQIISELKENVDDKEKTLELIEELSKTTDVYKKSLVCDNYIKVGKLTTRGEILLDDPINASIDNSQPINHYCPNWYVRKDYNNTYLAIDKFPAKEMKEIFINEEVIGYNLPAKDPKVRVSNIVFYDQYKTGEEKAVLIGNYYPEGLVFLLPNGSKTQVIFHDPRKQFKK